ncbi:MAG: thiamine ABC transporter substrate binding subunit [Saccharospirillaceae bacterium]|nr:thiamine ABC transporter substrate binding subunit [Pseudomonadales bacterium]NRB80792.1 thiamine ABC transporter substrate binding subunit [Saccharospirillaceae bacterium]
MKKLMLSIAVIALSVITVANAETKPTLKVYTYDSFVSEWGPGPQIKTAFEENCACILEFVGLADGVSILTRLKIEGKDSRADVVLGLDNNLMLETKDLNVLAQHNVDTSMLTVPGGWTDTTFVPFDWGYFAFIYDSEKMATPPKSLNELIESDLSVLYQDPRTSTPGLGLMLWMQAVYGDKTAAKYKTLATHTLTVTPDWWGAYEMFTSGEADMVLSYSTSPAYHVVAEGVTKYKAAAFTEGHYQQIEVAAITKNTKQPELAKSFLEFLISKKAQTIIPVTNWMMPVRSDVTLPEIFSEVIEVEPLLIDDETVKANRQTWINSWLEATAK